MCGENRSVRVARSIVAGSSPRVRGKLNREMYGDIILGLIPACAGKTRSDRATAAGSRAHPRVCGENRLSRKRPPTACRLIPACAGKTPSLRRAVRRCRAHPRVCGENKAGVPKEAVDEGSSPRVRGKHADYLRPRGRVRLIPACAGKTSLVTGAGDSGGAHPRVCGENPTPVACDTLNRGSSPRVRGKPTVRAEQTFHRGLIPACAGKTLCLASSSRTRTAHPRVCGENSFVFAQTSVFRGSSPRVRGKQEAPVEEAPAEGLIPACAGKT